MCIYTYQHTTICTYSHTHTRVSLCLSHIAQTLRTACEYMCRHITYACISLITYMHVRVNHVCTFVYGPMYEYLLGQYTSS